ncbi:riboflavin kinase [Candidatus Bathyarchaeota archaeon]|nr:MAG: riboflavin kinase [Candidatus Bathyarchaeota archaeon]
MSAWRKVGKTFFTLLALADEGTCAQEVEITTSNLARKIGSSQQTASRHLIELERAGLITRTVTRRGCRVKLTELGIKILKDVYASLKRALEPALPTYLVIKGLVFTGLGEGAYYVTREGYRQQFVEKLGFEPYPGTLNLRIVDAESLRARRELEYYPGIEIRGFKAEGRTFGAGKCFRALVNDEVEAAVVMAYRTHYGPSVLEVISPVCLREKLNLRDGDEVKVKVFL